MTAVAVVVPVALYVFGCLENILNTFPPWRHSQRSRSPYGKVAVAGCFPSQNRSDNAKATNTQNFMRKAMQLPVNILLRVLDA